MSPPARAILARSPALSASATSGASASRLRKSQRNAAGTNDNVSVRIAAAVSFAKASLSRVIGLEK